MSPVEPFARRADVELGRREMMAAALAAAGAPRRDMTTTDEIDVSSLRIALDGVRDELRLARAGSGVNLDAVDAVRKAQNAYLRATAKYPDYLEVGVGIWDGIYDWLRRQPQAVDAGRQRDGRYTMRFTLTTIVLRPDAPFGFIGAASDAR
jgi:hypothetical protein